MSTRTSFRPRPLDTTRQLNIVRDVKELDDGEQKVSRDIVHSHEALDKDNEEVNEPADSIVKAEYSSYIIFMMIEVTPESITPPTILRS